MKFYTEYLWFNTPREHDYVNITSDVEEILDKSGIKEGMILVSAMHITAGVYVNDAESGLIHDIDEWLEKVAPANPHYLHHRTGETNGDAHLKSYKIYKRPPKIDKKLIDIMTHDKKVKEGKINFVVPFFPKAVEIVNVEPEKLL